MWVCVSACGYGGGGEGERKSGHLQDRDRSHLEHLSKRKADFTADETAMAGLGPEALRLT